MKETTDFIPAADQRRDFNKQLCALVKIQVVDEITDVEGNVMGDIVNKGVEKWVYMAKDSRNMKIHLKNNLPVKVMFRDYDIDGLKSNRIYEIIINVQNSPVTPTSDNNGQLQMTVSPAHASIAIWDEESQRRVYKPDDNGSLKITLPYGRYQYEVTANDFHKKEGSVFISDETSPITINLSPVLGKLSISCPTLQADFFVNGKKIEKNKAAHTWVGEVPLGNHKIVASRQGYVSQEKDIVVTADDVTSIAFEALVSEKELENARLQKEKQEKERAEAKRRAEMAKAKAISDSIAKAKADSIALQQQIRRQKEERIKAQQKAEEARLKKIKRDSLKQQLLAKDKTSFVFGITAGYNMATANFDKKFDGTTGTKGSFHLGLTGELRLSNNFFFNTGLLYSCKGYTYENKRNDIDEEANAHFIEVPILASLRIPLGYTTKVQFCAGPYLGLCISGNIKDLWADRNGKKASDVSFSSAYSSFDYGMQAGVGFDFYYHYHVGINYQLGMASKYSNRNLMIGLGYRF
jgi:hypothetical protein